MTNATNIYNTFIPALGGGGGGGGGMNPAMPQNPGFFSTNMPGNNPAF